MKNSIILWLSMMLMCTTVVAKVSDNLLPKPQMISLKSGSFIMNKVALESSVLQSQWQDFITESGGLVVDKAVRKIEVKLVPEVKGAKLNQEEAYRLVVSSKHILVEATTEKGVYWALQTLRQLEEKKGRFEACEIVDWPAFKIRGFMHDIGRSYLSLDELKREIEILSRYKINVFHWQISCRQNIVYITKAFFDFAIVNNWVYLVTYT